MQIKQLVEQRLRAKYQNEREAARDPEKVKFPKVQITGENYEVTGTPAIISTIIGHLRMVAFALLFLGDYIFSMVGGINQFPRAVKDIYAWIKDNKFQFGLMVFFIGSMIQTNLMQSGAFEIYVNGNLEFSKLGTGRMPDFPAVQLIFRKYGIDI
jgi:selT/selW/selH-like putative selenoprotein